MMLLLAKIILLLNCYLELRKFAACFLTDLPIMANHQLDPQKWVDKYSDYLYNYTIVKVNDKEVAEDIISETFLAGLKSMKNFKGEASERTWLISILKRKIIDYYRKINSNKGKAEVRMNYSNDEEANSH